MQKITLSALRRNLLQTVDAVLASGQSIEVEHQGRRLRLVPDNSDSKLARFKPRTLVRGRAEDLATIKVGEWRVPELPAGRLSARVRCAGCTPGASTRCRQRQRA